MVAEPVCAGRARRTTLIGTKLGPYEITAKLGEGGMGEVYRATDTKLRRDVAIKVLPAAFTEDKERLARFEREAQLLAQLHHPNIASIFGLEESEGTKALIMELVDGPTLAERLEQGPLPFNESLSISLQMAQALEEAHEKGIVHRDLKPQNVKASMEGKVKVLDFGLAKAMDPAAAASGPGAGSGSPSKLAQSPTLTMGATVQGMILGTAAYMSPEQAKGMPVDKRADIWAFGVVTFEMLTGRQLFGGDSVTETLASVLRNEIDFAALPAATPPALRQLLRRCLERNPKNRLHDIADARLVLEDLVAGRGDEPVRSGAAPGAPVAPRRAAWQPWLFGFLLGAAAIGVVAFGLRATRSTPRPELLRFTISSASGAAITGGAGNSAISPDGRRVVFLGTDSDGRQGLWVQELDQIHARLLAGTEGASYPFWAPDSRRVAFFAKGMLNRVSLVDGRLDAICDAPDGRGGSWGRGGTIVFAPAVTGGLLAVAESGGSPKPATRIEKPEEEQSHRNPSFLPDGKRFVYIADPGANVDAGRVYLASLDGGERRFLYSSRRAPVFAAPGFLIDAIDDRLVARRFDPQSGELSGETLRLEETTPAYVNTQDRAASVSSSGALLVPSTESAGTKITWLDRRGRPVGEVPLPKGRFDMPLLSPDGRRLVVVSALPKEGESDLWIVDLASEQASRLSFAPGSETYPVWSPDGERIVFQTRRSGVHDLWIRPSSGGGVEQALFVSPTQWKVAMSWVGETLAFVQTHPETSFDVWLLRPERPSEAPRPLLVSAASEVEAAISPDERWLAYTSNESGRREVYVVSLPDAKVRYQVTTEGGQAPHWTRGGRELIFLTSGYSIAAVSVTPGDALAFGTPVTLFPRPRTNWGSSGDELLFDVTADGERIVLLEPLGEGSQTLIVVTDWQAELAAKGEPR